MYDQDIKSAELKAVYEVFERLIKANQRKYGFITPKMRNKIFMRAVETVGASMNFEEEDMIIDFEKEDLEYPIFSISELK